MGFNWGAALGAAVGTGTKTYLQLQEEARQAEEFQWKQKEQTDKENLAKVYKETIGAPETRTEAIPGTERASDIGPAIDTKQVAYTNDQRMKDFVQKSALMGIDPIKAQQAALGQYQTLTAARGERKGSKVEEFDKWNEDVADKMAKGDYAGLVESNLELYNKAPKGTHLNDGLTASVVPSADGKTSSFVQKDKDGKIVASTPITKELVESKLEQLAFAKYKALDFKGGTELGFKGREVAVKEAIAPSEINKNNAQAGAASMSAAVAGETLKDKRAARDAVRPFMDAYAKLSPEEQKGEKGQALLDQAEAGAAIKFGDISTLRKNSPVAKAEAGYERLYLESKKEADKNGEQFTPPDRAQYYGRVHGIASPEVVNLAQQRVNELIAAGKTKEAKAAVSEHNKIFYSPGSKIKLPE